VPRLIHLNGPSGVGKSTVAQLYVDRHPGVLNLDIDRIVTMIGGWRDDVRPVLGPARTIAIGMAGAHLADGRDVIMPQLVADHEQVARFESAAREAGGEYREIALTADRFTLRERSTVRRDRAETRTFVDDVLDEGGPRLLAKIYDDFDTYLRDRPDAIVLGTGDADADRTYTALVTALTDL
jgi:predicted kinase